MKLLPLLGCIVCLAVPCTQGIEFDELYQAQLADSKDLYSITHQYFAGLAALNKTQIITPQWLKNPARLKQYYHMRRLLGLVIDSGQHISDLQEFGIIDHENGHYMIDYARQPQWVTIRSLFLQFRTAKDLDGIHYYLRQQGLTSNDISKLNAYLAANNPQVIATQREFDIIETLQNRLPENDNSSLSLTIRTVEKIRKSRYQAWNQWGISLLNTLTIAKQQILLSYLQQNLGSVGIAAAPITEQSLLTFANQIRDGRAITTLCNRLANLKLQSEHEVW